MPKLIQRVADIADSVSAFLRSTASEPDRINAPGEPLQPQLPEGTAPRSFRTTAGSNLHLTPRSWPGVSMNSFDQLRSLGDFDLVRICIEDVKGQILGMDWEITVKQEHKEKAEELSETINEVRARVQTPDPLAGLDFRSWLSRVIEEILVTDALTLYPRFSRSGEPIGLEQADGATIMPLVDDRGRPPLDGAAYQQVMNGIVETQYTLPELWYLPRNRRADTPYGRSPTEQVLLTTNLAIRTSLYDLHWYTTGSVPDSVAFVPEGWTPDQIREFQQLFDEMLINNMERRSGGVKFLPGGQGALYQATKSKDWKYEYQEWLARVICWSFGVSPMPVAKIMNRATAEMQELSSLESGVKPVSDFLATIITRYINQVLQVPELQFSWGDDESEKSETVIARHQMMLEQGAMELDEARAQAGLDPLLDGALQTEKLGPIMQTPGGPVFLADILKSREAAASEDVPKLDPSLIQRAFLEVPIMRRDELRASVGLPAIGGDEGQEFVTISGKQPGDEPNANTPPQLAPFTGEKPTAGTPAEPASPAVPADKKGDAAAKEEEEEQETLKAAHTLHRDLVLDQLKALRKKKARCLKLGKAFKFESTLIPDWIKAASLEQVDAVITRLRKQAELELPKEAEKGEADLAALFQGWLESVLPELESWAVTQLKQETGQ